MKNLLILFLSSFLIIQSLASELVLIPTNSLDATRQLFNNPEVKVHFFRDEFAIATLSHPSTQNSISLDEKPWQENMSYYLVYTDASVNKASYKASIAMQADILHDGDFFLIVRTNEKKYGQLPPAKNDGMVRIFSREAQIADSHPYFRNSQSKEANPDIAALLEKVNGEYITQQVWHLQHYGTRDAYMPQSIDAQNWIKQRFLTWGLDVEVMDFTMPYGPASDNVIATHIGTMYPQEYVVLGGHYDSYSYSGDAPGADDNASGTSGVMEIARILSEYDFERTIVFCAFSGEEYGLYGSAAYAGRSAQRGKDILGYFNMDMIGYLKPGNTTMVTSLIYPETAQELADFYTQIVSVYLPDFQIIPASFTGGDSDHTSFNNNGYMGIFPFEDTNNYSPYIHTSNDLVGPSYNNQEQAVVFTQAILASVATMAGLVMPTGISKIDKHATLYPNPATDKVTISMEGGQQTSVTISNVAGQKVSSFTMQGSGEINITNLPAGIYMLQIQGGNFRETHKLLVQ
ncbi:MAG: M28 family peptidase [Bacteroidetes bacterium]|nr:MAG: M28 family peptidase [Bacteroidota bacterium]